MSVGDIDYEDGKSAVSSVSNISAVGRAMASISATGSQLPGSQLLSISPSLLSAAREMSTKELKLRQMAKERNQRDEALKVDHAELSEAALVSSTQSPTEDDEVNKKNTERSSRVSVPKHGPNIAGKPEHAGRSKSIVSSADVQRTTTDTRGQKNKSKSVADRRERADRSKSVVSNDVNDRKPDKRGKPSKN